MAVKIRLKRMGKIRAPFYRVVVMDSRAKRDGRAIEEIGKYHPTEDPSVILIDSARAQHWLAQGAQPTEPVEALLKITGDWQKFKGLDGTEGTLRFAAPKRSKRDLYDAAIAAAGGSSLDTPEGGATTPRKKAAKKAEPKAAEKAPEPAPEKAVDAPAVDAPAVDAPAVDAPAVDAPAAEAPAVDAPAVDAPAVEAPAVDAPAAEAPAVDAPAADAPAVDAPAADAPAAETPAAETAGA